MNARSILPAQPEAATDADLWRRSLDGDRSAFGLIVRRYQTLICSLAYSESGSLNRSEDLAQETFLAAWQQLGELREPARLKAWLCGIARNLAANAARREFRRGGPAVPLDDAPEPRTLDDPLGQTVSDEEQALMRRALDHLPATAREPMILFYREDQSVARVAELLDLSEDVVRQRLARGRAQLREALDRVLEGALARSAPSAAFTAAVLTALPALAPAPAKAGLAATAGAGVAKSFFSSLSTWALIGPAIGLVASMAGARAAASTGRSPEERAFLLRRARQIAVFAWVMSVALVAVLAGAGRLYEPSALAIVLGVLAWTAALVSGILWMSRRMEAGARAIRIATGTDAPRPYTLPDLGAPVRWHSRTRFLGLPLVDIAFGADVAGRSARAAGWLALGDIAVSPLLALGGFTAAPVALGAVTVGILSLSLWGIALGGIAFGTFAAGWHAFGLAAAGWQSAGGGAAVAAQYARGMYASAAEANSVAATAWFEAQWFTAPLETFAWNAHWLLIAIVVVALVRHWLRRPKR